MISQVRNYAYAQDSPKLTPGWVEDGSVIRGQTLSWGYTLPSKLLDRAHISRRSVLCSVQNLFISTKYTGYDPEVDTYNSGYGSNANLPRTSTSSLILAPSDMEGRCKSRLALKSKNMKRIRCYYLLGGNPLADTSGKKVLDEKRTTG